MSRRGFNLFKLLRRHFPATPLRRRAVQGRDPLDDAVYTIDDRLSHPAFAARDARFAGIERLQAAVGGTAATELDIQQPPSAGG
jgi:hypothetical protein